MYCGVNGLAVVDDRAQVIVHAEDKGMRRFTLHGRTKVNAQWQLFALVHNVEKIARGRWLG